MFDGTDFGGSGAADVTALLEDGLCLDSRPKGKGGLIGASGSADPRLPVA